MGDSLSPAQVVRRLVSAYSRLEELQQTLGAISEELGLIGSDLSPVIGTLQAAGAAESAMAERTGHQIATAVVRITSAQAVLAQARDSLTEVAGTLR